MNGCSRNMQVKQILATASTQFKTTGQRDKLAALRLAARAMRETQAADARHSTLLSAQLLQEDKKSAQDVGGSDAATGGILQVLPRQSWAAQLATSIRRDRGSAAGATFCRTSM